MFGFRKCFIFIVGGTQVCTYNLMKVSLKHIWLISTINKID